MTEVDAVVERFQYRYNIPSKVQGIEDHDTVTASGACFANLGFKVISEVKSCPCVGLPYEKLKLCGEPGGFVCIQHVCDSVGWGIDDRTSARAGEAGVVAAAEIAP